MKSLHGLPFLAAAVLAQDGPYPLVPFDELTEISKPYAAALIAVNESTIALDTSIIAFTGLDQVGALTGASLSLLQVIKDETATIETLQAFPEDNLDDISNFGTYVVNLEYYINLTVFDLVFKKQTLVDACVGPIVLEQIELQSSAAVVLQSSLIAKIPTSFQDIANTLASPIADALSSGVAAFADQSTTPASCAATTTASTTATSTSTTGTDTSLASSTQSTVIVTYGTGSQSAYSTTSPSDYATTSYTGPSTHPTKPSNPDDCDDNNGDGVYHTDGDTSVTVTVTSTHVIWEDQSSLGPSSAGQSYSTSSSTAGWSIITTELVHPHPHSTAASSSYIVQTTKPSSGAADTTTSKGLTYTTSVYGPYHGAAMTNRAAGLGATAIAAFVVAIFL